MQFHIWFGEIKRYIRDDGAVKVSRSIKELAGKINEIKHEYLKNNGKEITINEISEILKVPKEEIALAIDISNPIESIDEINFKEENNGETKETKISSKKDEAEQIAIKLTLSAIINNLEKREREIIILRYYKEKTQNDVARILGISQVQISRIEKRVLQSIKNKMVS